MRALIRPGTNPVIDVGISASAPPGARYTYPLTSVRMLLLFHLAGVIRRGARIETAELVLPVVQYGGKGGYVAVAPILQRWMPSEVSWTNRMSGHIWGTPGGLLGVDFGRSVSVSQGSSNPLFRINVRDHIQRWCDHPSENFGWVVTGTVWVGGATNPFQSQRPMLLMSYSTSRPRAVVGAGISQGGL